MSSMGARVFDPQAIRVQAREYAIGHPDCSREDVVRHLGLGVPLAVVCTVLDDLATSEERFARLSYDAIERRAIQAESKMKPRGAR